MTKPGPSVNLVHLSDAEIEALRLLPALVEHLAAAKAKTATLTLTAAARRVKRRTADVLQAVKSGALRARRVGRNWRIIASDADQWAAA